MKSIWKRLLLTSMITIAVTVLLSLLPQNMKKMGPSSGDVAVFRSVPVKRLSSDNLVDTMLGLQLQLKLKKVVWQQAVLSVDLSVEGHTNNTTVWMEDLEQLLTLAFMKAENVNRVLVRFVEPVLTSDSAVEKSHLIAATDIRRTDAWLYTDMTKVGLSDPFSDIFWKQRLRLSLAGSSSKVS